MLVLGVHPVAILSAVFCVISSLLMFVSDANSDHIVVHTRIWVLLWLCTWRVLFSFCLPHVVDVIALRLCSVLRVFVVLSRCFLYIIGPFSVRVGLPLHNILSPLLSIMDIFFVDLKFCHIRFYTL